MGLDLGFGLGLKVGDEYEVVDGVKDGVGFGIMSLWGRG